MARLSSSSKKLRMAFIGAGGIAAAHLNALKDFDDVKVVALADVNQKGLESRGEEFGVPADGLFTDYKKMLKAVQPDAVNICTPNGLHAPNAIAASKAGAHVIVEKPMGMNAAECKKMIAAAKAAKKKLVIGFQYRFDPKTAFLTKLREDGLFGDIRFGRVQALRRRGIPNWGVFGQKDLQGGGPLIDIGVHVLEMCHFTMGSPKPVAAVGMTDTYLGNKPSNKIASNWAGWDHKTYTVEDLAVGHIRFENGAVIHIESSFAAHHEHAGTMDFQIMGTKGGAKWGSSEVFTDQNGHMMNLSPAWLPSMEGGFGGYFSLKLRDFVDHVTNGKPSMAPAEHGLMVQQMLDAIYASADKGGKEVLIKA
ncbi:MAG: Gfo/Idh/MocA family oxidoreductase [Planctomycetota bacterium]